MRIKRKPLTWSEGDFNHSIIPKVVSVNNNIIPKAVSVLLTITI